jgi:hypothetical protein
MELLLYVGPYSEIDEDKLIVYCVNTRDIPEDSKKYITAKYVGDVNLTQRFFIKGDKSLQRVVKQTEHTIILENQEDTFYRIDHYFKNGDGTITQLGQDAITKINEIFNAPYRPKHIATKQPKINFF